VNGRLRALAGSFRGRLVLGYALVVLLLAGIWAWSLYEPLTKAALDQQRSHLESIARVSAIALSETSASPAAEVRRLVRGTGLRETVVASDGKVLADSGQDPSSMENHATRPEIAAALKGAVGTDARLSTTQGIEQMYVAVPSELRGELVAVRISEPLATIHAIADRARETGLLLLVAALAAAIYAGWRLSASATQPVLRLRDAAEAMASGDLHAPVPGGTGELGEVSASLLALRDNMRGTIAELEAGQAMLRAVLDGLQDAVFLFEGDRIELASRAASALFRAPATGWRGARLSETALPASLAASLRGLLASETTYRTELGPDPEGRYHRVTVVPLNPTDRARRTLAVIADVTEVRRLDAVRRDFVANASHELKTPASAIQLLAEAAGHAAEDGDTAEAMEFVEQIAQEADRLRRLVVDLIDLSRLERPPGGGSVTDLRAAVANSVTAHGPAATAAGLRLSLDQEAVADADVYTTADATDLAIALDNVLANAISYTERGSVTVRLSASDDTVSVAVSDTGPGIPAEHLPRIFERFYRVDAARQRASGGTGLGLSLVRNAAERSGGSVGVHSQVGVGTTVTIDLPRAR
jgi:two-component system phosphate regulon sensor histidine kinase PhoR